MLFHICGLSLCLSAVIVMLSTKKMVTRANASTISFHSNLSVFYLLKCETVECVGIVNEPCCFHIIFVYYIFFCDFYNAVSQVVLNANILTQNMRKCQQAFQGKFMSIFQIKLAVSTLWKSNGNSYNIYW